MYVPCIYVHVIKPGCPLLTRPRTLASAIVYHRHSSPALPKWPWIACEGAEDVRHNALRRSAVLLSQRGQDLKHLALL